MDDSANDKTLAIRCPAKLNLTLAVGSPRPDGLHPIASVMVALDFGDDLQLHRLENGPSEFTRRFADDAPKAQPIDWPIERDLAFRAHAKLEQAVGRPLPVSCTVDKRIPAGAGLGGGSSNAAGMLVGLRSLFDLSIGDDELLDIAQSLGADVTFLAHALLGHTAALVTGIGQVIEPIDTIPAFHATLVFPDGTCPTAAVYQSFDKALGNQPKSIPHQLHTQWRDAGRLPDAHNDLTQAAIHVCPAVMAAIQAIKSLNHEPRLTGSGSCVFSFMQTKQDAVAIAETLTQLGLAACSTHYSKLP
ncbi:MAG: 4-(cytidine 5'-diphospho)-2-C-methyl-D-erythritol kinase [Phycisphaeraceae bacterium]